MLSFQECHGEDMPSLGKSHLAVSQDGRDPVLTFTPDTANPTEFVQIELTRGQAHGLKFWLEHYLQRTYDPKLIEALVRS